MWLIERGRSTDASGIAWGLLFFWLIRGRAAEGLPWYQEILKLPSLPPASESRALVGSAVMWYARGELERARTSLTRVRALALGADDMDVVVQAENLFGHVENAVGDVNAAGERFAYSLEGFRTLAIPWGTGNALIGMAGVALATGDADTAERLLDEATSVLRHAGPWFLNLPLYLRAILAVRRGNPDQAIALVRESLTCSRELHDKFSFVYALTPLAAAAVLKGDDAWAARILGARDAVTERTGATIVDKSVQHLRENAEQGARARIGPDRWAEAYAAGRVASIDSLIKDIDSVLRIGARSDDRPPPSHGTGTRPYSRGGKIARAMKPGARAVVWRAAQSAARGGGLHAGGAGDDRGPLGSCRERAGARGTTAAPRRDRACAVRGARPDRSDP